MKKTFAQLASEAQHVANDLKIAHDLFRQGDKGAISSLEFIANDLARMTRETIELADSLKSQCHAEV